MKFLISLLFLIFQVLFVSCVTEDYSKIDSSLEWRPNFSIPLGSQRTTIPQPPLLTPPSSIILQDTIAYSFEHLFKEQEYIESLLFRVQAVNSYPATAIINVSYYDSQGNLLGSFTKNRPLMVDISNVDSSNGTTVSGHTITDYPIPVSEFETLKLATKIILVTEFQNITLSQPLIDNWSNFSLVATVGLQVQINRKS